MENKIKFNFYPTLLDKFESYLSSSRIYQEFWGFSENPTKTEEEFEQEQLQSLIDSINRVPFESEAADKGTAFNEVIDCIIEKRTSEKMSLISEKEKGIIKCVYKNYTFEFPYDICIDIAKYFSGAVTQYRVDGILETKYGSVNLYGYIDELMPFFTADIKTTSKYHAFKFRNNWQHKIYPYCLIQNGINIPEFQYVVTDFKTIWTEDYIFNAEKDTLELTQHCEAFIEFLENNKSQITDTKIFGR